jgi:cytochrome c5
MNAKNLLISGLMLSSALAFAHAAQQTQPAVKKSHGAMHNDQDDEGQRVFDANCSRCHAAPQGFSPRIAGTVVRHMRVCASLSEQDEKALLHFLNP